MIDKIGRALGWTVAIVFGWVISFLPIATTLPPPSDRGAVLGLMLSPAFGMAFGALLVYSAMRK